MVICATKGRGITPASLAAPIGVIRGLLANAHGNPTARRHWPLAGRANGAVGCARGGPRAGAGVRVLLCWV